MTTKNWAFCEKVVMLSVSALAIVYAIACLVSIWQKLWGRP